MIATRTISIKKSGWDRRADHGAGRRMLAVPQYVFAGVTSTALGLAHHGTLAVFVAGLLLCATSALIAFVVATRVTIDIIPASL